MALPTPTRAASSRSISARNAASRFGPPGRCAASSAASPGRSTAPWAASITVTSLGLSPATPEATRKRLASACPWSSIPKPMVTVTEAEGFDPRSNGRAAGLAM